jgi:hypothetical protein
MRNRIDRITVEMVRQAMDLLGATLEPETDWDQTRKCGCPLGILAAAKSKEYAAKGGRYGSMSWVLGIDLDYACGMISGFDQTSPKPKRAVWRELLGYEDGEMIRSAPHREPVPAGVVEGTLNT